MLAHGGIKLGIGRLGQLPTGDSIEADLSDAKFVTNSGGRARVITGDHDHANPSALCLFHSGSHFGPRRVDDSNDTQVDQVVLDRLVDWVAEVIEASIRHGECA